MSITVIRSVWRLSLGLACVAACDVRASTDDHAINPWIFARVAELSPGCERLCEYGSARSLPSCGARCEWLVATAAELDDDLGGECSAAFDDVLECAALAGDELARRCSPEFAVQAAECGGEPLLDARWQACHEHCDDAMIDAEPAYASWFECQQRCERAQPA